MAFDTGEGPTVSAGFGALGNDGVDAAARGVCFGHGRGAGDDENSRALDRFDYRPIGQAEMEADELRPWHASASRDVRG